MQQEANLAQTSAARLIQENNNNHNHPGDDDSSNNTPIRSNGINNNINGDSSNSGRGVSFAYSAGSGRQPMLNNLSNLFHLGVQSLGAFAESLFGPSSSDSSARVEGNDQNNGKDRSINCYIIPCLSCGKGERGRANIRMLSTLFFPLFLLSFFLLDDFGHVIMQNIKLRHGSKFLKAPLLRGNKAGVIPIVIRRKMLNEFPGIRRELLWVPLENTLTIDENTSVQAKMKCPKGVLFLFHGCQRYAASFFYSPQGRRLVSMAYKAGVAIVAFEKHDEKGCWDWEQDGEAVLKIGRKFLMSRTLGACGEDSNGESMYPPIWAFGASSGGSFISMLATQMAETPHKYAPFLFSALNVQISSPSESLDWDIPTIFTVMDGDTIMKEKVEERVAKKFQAGPFKMISTSGQKSIHPNHFSRVFPDDKQMTLELSNNIHGDLVTMGIVDASNNDRLVDNPRQYVDAVTSIWEKYDMSVRVAEASESEDVLPFGLSNQLMRPLRKEELADANSIWLTEELNVAWDQHEITVERFDDVLSFFFQYGIPAQVAQAGRG